LLIHSFVVWSNDSTFFFYYWRVRPAMFPPYCASSVASGMFKVIEQETAVRPPFDVSGLISQNALWMCAVRGSKANESWVASSPLCGSKLVENECLWHS
jgi:hypothetical protein